MTLPTLSGRLDASVIISTHNRAAILQQTLQCLSLQETNGFTWEAIVIDNGCTDNTPEVLDSISQNLSVVSLREPKLGKNRAINRALEVARGDLLIFTDDDVLTEDDWIESYVSAARRWESDSVFCGPIIPKFPAHTPCWMQEGSFPFAAMAFSKLDFSKIEEASPLAFGPNLAIRSQALRSMTYNESIGPQGKNYAMGSETELLRRLQAQGERFIYIPSTRVEHVIRPEQVTVSWLLGRAFRAGRGHVRLKDTYLGKRIFGAPRYMWKKLAWAAVRRMVSFFRGKRKRCIAGMQYWEIRGRIAEYRSRLVVTTD